MIFFLLYSFLYDSSFVQRVCINFIIRKNLVEIKIKATKTWRMIVQLKHLVATRN